MAPTAESSLAFVNLESLAARDEREIAPIANGISAPVPVERASWVRVLPGLPASSARQDVVTRRSREGRALATNAQLALDAHLDVIATRQTQVIAQRSAELLASEREAQIESLQKQIGASSARTRAEVENLSATLADLQRARAIYTAQLRAGILGGESSRVELDRLRERVGSEIQDLADLQETIRALKGGATVDFRPAPRARMTVMAEAAETGRSAVASKLSKIWKDADTERRDIQTAFEIDLKDRVKAKLAPLRKPVDSEILGAEARREVTRALEVEARTSDFVGAMPDRQIRVQLVASPPENRRIGDSRDARARLRREELIAQIQDAAERRHVIVAFTPFRGVPDRTEEFAAWIGMRKGKT